MRRPPAVVTVVLVGALLAGGALAPATASPQPTPICPACGASFERAADNRGVDVTVRESTVLVQVHGNGSATWTIRNRLNTTDGFREAPGTLAAMARPLVADGYGPPEDATVRDTRLDGDSAVLVLRDPDAAGRRAGLLVVDYLHDGGGEPLYHVNTERFTIRGPSGTAVVNSPESGTIDGQTATWYGSSGGYTYEAPDLEGSPYVVFGPEGTSGVQAGAAIALATLPIVVESLGQFVLFQTLLFAAVLGVVGYGVSSRTFEHGPMAFGGIAAALGGVTAVALVVAQGVSWLPGPALVGVGLGVLVNSSAFRERSWTPGGLAGVAGGLLLASFLLLLVVHAAVGTDRPVELAISATALGLPLAAMLPLGGSLGGERRRTLAWATVTVLAFVAVPVTLVNLADPPSGLGGGVHALFLTVVAVVGPVVGALVLATGRTLAGGRAAQDS